MNDYRAKVVKNNVPHPCFLQNFKRLYKRYNKKSRKTQAFVGSLLLVEGDECRCKICRQYYPRGLAWCQSRRMK